MIIERCLYFQADELKAAVVDVMSLFAIPVLADTYRSGDSDVSLPETAILVCNYINNDPLTVKTEISYWDKGAIITRRLESPRAPADEERHTALQRLTRLNLLAIMKAITGQTPSPWGILRGVRPTKIPHKMLDRGLNGEDITDILIKRYALSAVKAGLICEIALRQRPFLHSKAQAKRLVSVYVGIPYCPSRCLYCSFPGNVLPRERSKVEAFLQALYLDIEAAAKLIARHGLEVESIYVGGGTPTSLPSDDFSQVLDWIVSAFSGAALREFTVEAGRPDSIDAVKINSMKKAGVGRISVNPQTMQEKTLKLIGRKHTVHDIMEILEKIRYVGIPTVNMDIIVGLPGEEEADITSTLEQIASLEPENLTVHTLAIKKGSLLKDKQVEYHLPEEKTVTNMLAIADGYTRKWGMVPYYLYRQKYMVGNLENIGYAKAGQESIYNIQIIEERQTIIGIGPAAATKAVNPGNWRLESSYHPKDLKTYVNNIYTCLERRETLLARLFTSEEE